MVLALVIASAGCSNEYRRHHGAGRVHDSKYRFSILPPEGWAGVNPGAPFFLGFAELRTGVVLLAMVTTNGTIQKRDLLKIQTDGGEEVIVRMYTIVTPLENYKILDTRFLTIDGKDAYSCSLLHTKFEAQFRTVLYAIFPGKKNM